MWIASNFVSVPGNLCSYAIFHICHMAHNLFIPAIHTADLVLATPINQHVTPKTRCVCCLWAGEHALSSLCFFLLTPQCSGCQDPNLFTILFMPISDFFWGNYVPTFKLQFWEVTFLKALNTFKMNFTATISVSVRRLHQKAAGWQNLFPSLPKAHQH